VEPQAAQILETLRALGIAFELTEHAPVFTIAELISEGLDRLGEVPKNLFLRDAGGKRHYLIVTQKDRLADLCAIREAIGSSRLSFASEDRLKAHLNLTRGAVTPLAAIFDTKGTVCVYIDTELMVFPRLGVHAGTNTQTVWLTPGDLIGYLRASGHDPSLLAL
jgi:Ala-tRNA(Pro) deacylase